MLSFDNVIKGPWSRNTVRLYSTDGMTLTGEKDARRKRFNMTLYLPPVPHELV